MKRHIASSSIAGAAIIAATCALSTAPTFAHNALAAGTTTNQLPTVTTLTVSAPFLGYGQEQFAHLSVTVQGDGIPTGTVAITSGTTTLCTVSLTAGSGEGTGSCTLTPSQLDPGNFPLAATYSGDDTFAPSAGTGSLYVEEPTTTVLSLSSPTITSYDEKVEVLTATVTDALGITPTGTVEISTGYTKAPVPFISCDATLTPSGVAGTAVGSCSPTSDSPYPPGLTSLQATYDGDSADGLNGSYSDALVTVAADPTTTTIRLSAPQIVYGHEQSEKATVTLSAKYPAELVGGVIVSAGSKVLCVISSVAGPAITTQRSGSCLLPASGLGAGSPTLTASYSGYTDPYGLASSSASTRVTVIKAATRVALKLSASTVVYGHEQSERFSVTVTPQYAGALSGTVTIRAGRTTLCRITIKYGKHTGTCSPSAKALPTGRYTITAVYSGNSDYSGATYRTSYLTIKR